MVLCPPPSLLSPTDIDAEQFASLTSGCSSIRFSPHCDLFSTWIHPVFPSICSSPTPALSSNFMLTSFSCLLHHHSLPVFFSPSNMIFNPFFPLSSHSLVPLSPVKQLNRSKTDLAVRALIEVIAHKHVCTHTRFLKGPACEI